VGAWLDSQMIESAPERPVESKGVPTSEQATVDPESKQGKSS
jgi:hypothetical protein